MTQIEAEALMVAVVDGVASPSQREALMSYLKDHPGMARELEEHMSLKALTDGWVKRLEVDVIEDRHAAAPATRLAASLGAALVLAGLGVITGFGLAELLLDPSAPLWLRVGTGLGTAGGLILLIAVVSWKLKTWKRDPYTEVVR